MHSRMLLRKELFWEYDVTKLDLERDYRTIIPRVLERGTWDDWKESMQIYGKAKIQEVLLQTRYLNEKSLHFAAFLFDTPIENFTCYGLKQLNRAHWNY